MTFRSSIAVSALASVLVAASAAAQAPPSLLGRPTSSLSAESEGPQRPGLFGRSGALRVAVVRALESLDLPFVEAVAGAQGTELRWKPLFGTRHTLLGEPVFSREVRTPPAPGVWELVMGREPAKPGAAALAFITEMPIARKKNGYLNGYHIGTYPAERTGLGGRYATPQGFIEVTPENQDMQLSEHFRLRQFLTKDQHSVWPKYVALDLRLVDKLELVMQELNAMGIRAERWHVMSGYRTPQYNGPGGDGRAKLSRHTYGDAADGWVDNDGNGYMDDLNGDGRVDLRDAQVILRAVDRVEQKHPELIGGAGLYNANSAHGPFIHIDVRGTKARW